MKINAASDAVALVVCGLLLLVLVPRSWSTRCTSYTAFKDGMCFQLAMRLAAWEISKSLLVTERLVSEFEETYEHDVSLGITDGGIASFIEFLHWKKAALSLSVVRKNLLNRSTNTVWDLDNNSLSPGVFVVAASYKQLISHCFVIRVPADGSQRLVYHHLVSDDDFVTWTTELLMNLAWILRAHFIRAVEEVGKVPRAKRSAEAKLNQTCRQNRGRKPERH